MCAHADDLRSEGIAEETVRGLHKGWRSAPELTDVERAMLAFAEKLTLSPSEMREEDVRGLRKVGWSDRAISDIVQVAAYFNYINRIADGLGVDLEEGMTPKATT